MKLPTAIALSLVVASTSLADKVTLTYKQLMDLSNALNALDGYTKVVDGKPIGAAYDFSGRTRLAIGTDITAVKGAFAKYREALAPDAKADGIITLPNDTYDTSRAKPDQLIHFSLKFNEVASIPTTIELTKIETQDLKLEEPTSNPIPGSVLSALVPIIK